MGDNKSDEWILGKYREALAATGFGPWDPGHESEASFWEHTNRRLGALVSRSKDAQTLISRRDDELRVDNEVLRNRNERLLRVVESLAGTRGG